MSRHLLQHITESLESHNHYSTDKVITATFAQLDETTTLIYGSIGFRGTLQNYYPNEQHPSASKLSHATAHHGFYPTVFTPPYI
jgi:hypothetical protein